MWEILIHQMILFSLIYLSTRLERYILCVIYLYLVTLTWFQIYDSFSSFWSHVMTDIRDLVQMIYSWDNNKILKIIILYIIFLLMNDKFCYKDLEICISLFLKKKIINFLTLTQSEHDQFMSDIIIKDIDKIFFNSENSLKLYHISVFYFVYFNFNLIVFIIVVIRHVIKKWWSDIKKINWFDCALSHDKRLFSLFMISLIIIMKLIWYSDLNSYLKYLKKSVWSQIKNNIIKYLVSDYMW